MWHNSKTVQWVHSKNGSQACWAIVEGLNGWKRVKTGSTDGVTNIYLTLCMAKSNGKKVNVYINGDTIEQVTL